MADDYTPSDLDMQEAWISTYARDGWLTEEAILRGQREFKAYLASVWRAAFEEAAGAVVSMASAREAGFGPHPDFYQEGVLDALDLAEQKVRALGIGVRS